ncbi:hypothetical protein EG329_013833 [Mollisiaceae sp. DMI_Dod_QoI]|nr:hypothetical protein EG329_013833 [Helotiales sp. DMI_Dod_QoI]
MPFATIHNKKLFYTDSHDSTSTSLPTALFLHGLGSSSCFYASITPGLKDIVRCIALDYPGSGLSELGNSEEEEQSISTLARDALTLLATLNITSITLIGHSIGGLLASYLASTHPPHLTITAIILLGPVDPSPSLPIIFRQRISTIKSHGLEPLADSIPTAATGSSSTALQHAFIRALILGTSERGYVSLCNVIASAERPEYGKVKVPVLVLVGEEDKTSSLESCEGVLREYGTAGDVGGEGTGREDERLVVLRGVGHWHCVEDAEGVGRHVRGFLESVASTTAL